jgi:hypothetical protein
VLLPGGGSEPVSALCEVVVLLVLLVLLSPDPSAKAGSSRRATAAAVNTSYFIFKKGLIDKYFATFKLKYLSQKINFSVYYFSTLLVIFKVKM